MKNGTERRDSGGRFLMGHNGGPGRPKGSRNKLSEDFFADVLEAWTEHGKEALEYTATKHPTMFLRLVGSLIPRHFEFEAKHPYADLTREQLEQRLRELHAQVGEYFGETEPRTEARNLPPCPRRTALAARR
jgi:hypothetical protein